MGIHLAEQTAAFLWSIAAGAALGLAYDVFRVSRVAFRTHKAIIFAEDVLFFVFCAGVTFLFLMSSVDGKVRFFLLIGEFIGALVYYLTAGRLVMKASGFIIGCIKSVLNAVFRYIIRPVWRLVYALVLLLLRPFRFLGLILKKTLRKLKFSLKTKRVVLYNHFNGVIAGIKLKSARRKRITDGSGEGEGQEGQ